MKIYYDYLKDGIRFRSLNKEGEIDDEVVYFIPDMYHVRNHANGVSINFLGQMVYATRNHEPVAKHLMNEILNWGDKYQTDKQLSSDFEDLSKVFPDLHFAKYLSCVQHLLKKKKNEEAH